MNEHINPPITEVRATQDWKHHFCTATPLSKALAMLLFITLPFIGFWLGIKYGSVQTQSLGQDETQTRNSYIETEPILQKRYFSSGQIMKEEVPNTFDFSRKAIDVDGVPKYPEEGGGFSEVGLKDQQGNFIWKFQVDENLHPNRLTYGDINADRTVEFYIADRSGVYQLDTNGNMLWHFQEIAPSDFTDVEVVQPYVEDSYIVALTGNNSSFKRYYFLDHAGNLIKTLPKYKDEFNFDVVYYMGQPCILTGYPENHIIVRSMDGEVLIDHDLGGFPAYHGPTGIPVNFDREENPYLAVLSESSSTGKEDLLSIFSPYGDLVYEESLPTRVPEMRTQLYDDGSEILIIDVGVDSNDFVLSFSKAHDSL